MAKWGAKVLPTASSPTRRQPGHLADGPRAPAVCSSWYWSPALPGLTSGKHVASNVVCLCHSLWLVS